VFDYEQQTGRPVAALMTIPGTATAMSTIKLVAFTGARFLNELSCPLGAMPPSEKLQSSPSDPITQFTQHCSSILKGHSPAKEQPCPTPDNPEAVPTTAQCRDPSERTVLSQEMQNSILSDPILPHSDSTSDDRAEKQLIQRAPASIIEGARSSQLSGPFDSPAPQLPQDRLQAQSDPAATDVSREGTGTGPLAPDTSREGAGTDLLVSILRGDAPAQLSPHQVLELVDASQLYMADAVLAALPLYLAPMIERLPLMVVRYHKWHEQCIVVLVRVLVQSQSIGSSMIVLNKTRNILDSAPQISQAIQCRARLQYWISCTRCKTGARPSLTLLCLSQAERVPAVARLKTSCAAIHQHNSSNQVLEVVDATQLHMADAVLAALATRSVAHVERASSLPK
jgi:hypothetical protein